MTQEDIRTVPWNVRLEPADFRTVVRAAFGTEAASEATRLGGGFSNILLHFTVAGQDGSFVLRLYRRGAAIAAIESELLQLLQGCVPVPELIFSDPQGALIGHPMAITRFVEGVLLDRVLAEGNDADVAEVGRVVGGTLADIGRLTFARGGFFGPGLVPMGEPDMSSGGLIAFVREHLFEGPAATALEPSIRDRYWDLIQAAAPQLDAVAGASSLVHADYNGKNILVAHDGKGWRVAAVLDWEFALAASPLLDLGNMLRFSHLMHPDYVPAFLEGYRANGGELSTNWYQIARLLDVFPLCQFLAAGPSTPFFEPVRQLVMKSVERGEI